jgi:hypothetical protein
MTNPVERYDYVELLLRVTEFRKLVQTNVFWPTVPDTTINPMIKLLLDCERILAGHCYTDNQLEKLNAIQKASTK